MQKTVPISNVMDGGPLPTDLKTGPASTFLTKRLSNHTVYGGNLIEREFAREAV